MDQSQEPVCCRITVDQPVRYYTARRTPFLQLGFRSGQPRASKYRHAEEEYRLNDAAAFFAVSSEFL
eukprot:COSAG05_NODE_5846_length_1074_cov_1.171282_1_plen_67_part_00